MGKGEGWDALQFVSQREIIELTQEAVRRPSENPPGDEAGVAELFRARFEAEGVDACTYWARHPSRLSMGATLGSGEVADLMFTGHTDTVPLGDRSRWRHSPLGAEIEAGRIYGRGTADMKGPLAAAAMALIALKRSSLPLRGKIQFLATADEEMGGGEGAGFLAREKKVKARMALMLEPSHLAVVVAHPGRLLLRLTTRGRPAHASSPELGENAILKMVDVLNALRSLTLCYEPHPYLLKPSVALATTISGGTKDNVIPDTCSMTADIRSLPGQTEQSLLRDVRACLSGLADEVEFQTDWWSPPVQTKGCDSLVAAARDAASRVLGRQVQLEGYRACTDSHHWVTHAKIPIVVAFGPGGLEVAHTFDEYIEIDELVQATRIYFDLMLAFAGPPED